MTHMLAHDIITQLAQQLYDKLNQSHIIGNISWNNVGYMHEIRIYDNTTHHLLTDIQLDVESITVTTSDLIQEFDYCDKEFLDKAVKHIINLHSNNTLVSS